MEYLVMLPGPTNVPNRVINAMLTPMINHRSDDFRKLYKDIISKTQKVFETENDIVVLTTSGTGAVETSVVNLIKKDDVVIIPVNGEFSTRLADLIDNYGGKTIRINSPYGKNPPIEKIQEAFEKNSKVKALYVVYNETSTGTTLRYLSKLGDICKAHGAFFVVDAVSILGGDELPVDKWNVDICFTATQKALAAPPGIAPISISKEAKKYMIENPPASQYLNLKRYFKYYNDSFETPFTPAISLFYAYQEALNIILEEGIQNRIERHRKCANAFYSGLEALGFTPFADANSRSNVVIAVNYLPGIDDKRFRELISSKFKVLLAGGFGELKGKVFRVGCMGEVSSYHVMRTLSAISSSMSILGVPPIKDGLSVANNILNQ
ncbi:MAG: alanine--glyoxylate aminotransferase family protein [Nitrososphaeraceae archaeon]|nr:alanine--glyoxylate aminotransferase family protein [Nitrososphaeraceae archaeon]MDW0195899.1 alanine--glyoxylate aminotransferase family protein [Nitrososphaeraceae archaeon]MDW0198992.1 alanine--glyoxylate aminotransferase family protein [Nitrososphaeraceae archaeon]MDW0200492.1 alanine--glyoxylate aminotransferase family protein [Nitrososphaeraceae archaeon]MDW0211424.1 alanine--glyoxylate aminotransferase family protein [Nitrososphaeraceae archaeon]